MDKETTQSRAARLSQLTAVLLAGMVMILSYQLISLKDERQRLLADADVATRAFTRGLPLPSLPVVNAQGRAAVLDHLCESGTQLVTVFTDLGCPECSEIAPLVDSLSTVPGLKVAAVYSVSFPSPRDLKADDAVRRLRSNLDNVVNVARVGGVPSVIVADGSCVIVAAGAGLTGSRIVLERILAQPGAT